uniref:Uncharacterized protein n=1 Tax=Magallana gigas TaxID=29159 RepID=A0A8W8NU59_MAGGI
MIVLFETVLHVAGEDGTQLWVFLCRDDRCHDMKMFPSRVEFEVQNSFILNSKYTVGTVSLIICKKLSFILGNKEQEGDCKIKLNEEMESETKSNKRKRLDEESDESKQEKRPRLDDTFEKHEETLRNNNTTAVSKAPTPILDNINDTESNKTEEDESYRFISVSESKNGKENAVFIKMPAKSDACCLPVIDIEKEDGAIEMTASARSLYSKDYLNDEEIRNYDASISSTIVSESKSDDESKGRDTKAEKDDLKMAFR